MPFKNSNIPSNMFYSAIGAESLRIARACNSNTAFSRAMKPLIVRMVKQGACKQRVINNLHKFFNRHQEDFKYVSTNCKDLLSLLF